MAVLALALCAGCQDDITTPFPEGLEPLEDNPIPPDDSRAEELRLEASTVDHIRIYGRGYVHAPPAVVWSATKDPEVMAAVCHTTSHAITLGAEPGSEAYELAYVVHYYVDDILDVEWDDAWRYGTIAGAPDAPTRGMIKHQKIAGSDFVSLSAGTIEILATDDPDVTELSFVEHLDAIQASSYDVAVSVKHNFDTIVATVHERPVPSCQ
ncbi:MAG: hypothetical protein JNL83_02325 [Myxococcales bacterium]|nr:hypothetical protein [Myxococcales bacterium]